MGIAVEIFVSRVLDVLLVVDDFNGGAVGVPAEGEGVDLTLLHLPYSDWQPFPQKAEVLPHRPFWLEEVSAALIVVGCELYLQQSPYMELRHVAPLLDVPHFAFCETEFGSRGNNKDSQSAIWKDVAASRAEE